jgi:hypothetical protein
MSGYIYKTIEVNIGGDKREVEFRHWVGDREFFPLMWSSVQGNIAVFTKGRGGKLWPHGLTMWQHEDGTFKLAKVETILNRCAYMLAGWADKLPQHRSQHNSAHR